MSRLILIILDKQKSVYMRKFSQQPVDGHRYRVVTNEEGQYAVWQYKLAPPAGWITMHYSNSQEECLKFIDNNWLNIMPKSFQK